MWRSGRPTAGSRPARDGAGSTRDPGHPVATGGLMVDGVQSGRVTHRANYALLFVGAHLGPDADALAVDWADYAGDRTDRFEFEVPTDAPADAYIGLQAFDVGEYGHEVVINGDSLSGFDLPPRIGWQYWTDTIVGAALAEGTNTLRIARDADTDDSFAIGNVTVHWKEPVE